MPRAGDKIKIIANNTGHRYIIGDEYKILRIEESGVSAYNTTGAGGESLQPSEYEVVYDTFSIKTLEDREKELHSLLNRYKYVIDYLEENSLEECSLNEINADLMIHYLKNNQLKELTKILNEINSSFCIDKLKHH